MLFNAPWSLAQVTEYRDRDHQCQGGPLPIVDFRLPIDLREFRLEVQQKYREYRTERVAKSLEQMWPHQPFQLYKHSITVPGALATALSKYNPSRIYTCDALNSEYIVSGSLG